MRLTHCGSCASDRLDLVLDLGTSPLADEFPTNPGGNEQRWPLQLLRCDACTLVQLSEVVPDDVLWGGDYGFYSGASAVVVADQAAYARELIAEHPELCARGVVEIACNDGTMLRHFAAAGYESLGVDPAKGPAAAAQAAGLDVWVEPFTADAARRIVANRGPAGLIVANNVIAHVTDLNDFLRGIAALLGLTGAAVVEFQYFADLVLGNQFDHVYHEHRRFLTLTALSAALCRHGLEVTHVRQTTPQGGSLRVTIRHVATHPVDQSVGRLLEQEHWLNQWSSLAGLQGRADRLRDRLTDRLRDLRDAGARVAAYGASAKATTLLNWCGIGPDLVQYVVDTTPTKHGRYMPGTAIPIISPTADSRAPDVYLLTVWNYLPAVLRREAGFTAAGGRWLVPIPQPVIL